MKSKLGKFFCAGALIFGTWGCPTERASPPTPPDEIRRIITYTPSLTETVFALGAGDLVVGNTVWCNYPPEAQKVERVGDILQPSYERIVALKPDLFIVQASLKEIGDKIERLGIAVLRVPILQLEDIAPSIETIAKAIGREARGKELIEEISKTIQEIQRKVEKEKPPEVLLVLERQPGTILDITAVGPNNVIDSLLRIAGGKNVLHDFQSPYPKVSKEEILKRSPEFIFDFSVHGLSDKGNDEEALQSWSSLASVRAVKEKNIVVIPKDFDFYPGPRIGTIAERLARILHPQLFRE